MNIVEIMLHRPCADPRAPTPYVSVELVVVEYNRASLQADGMFSNHAWFQFFEPLG